MARRLGHNTRLALGIQPLERHRGLHAILRITRLSVALLQLSGEAEVPEDIEMESDVDCMCKHLSRLVVL